MLFPKLFPSKSITQNLFFYSLVGVIMILSVGILHKVQMNNLSTLLESGCDYRIMSQEQFTACVNN